MPGWGQLDVNSEAHFRSLLTLAKPACAHEGSVFCCSACRRRRLPCWLDENDCCHYTLRGCGRRDCLQQSLGYAVLPVLQQSQECQLLLQVIHRRLSHQVC